MQERNLPVVMLAAGMGKRFELETRDVPKSLLKISESLTIFDLIQEGLLYNDVSCLYVILGYKPDIFLRYLEKKSSDKIKITPIRAKKDFVRGPLFSLLSILPVLKDEIKKIVVIPSDTIFHPEVLTQVFANIDEFNDNLTQIFTLEVTQEQIRNFNRLINFKPRSITNSSALYSLFLRSGERLKEIILLPILVLSRSFIDYVNSPENRISGKIIDNLEKYYSLVGNCTSIQIKYDKFLPPFIDVDTFQIYSALISVKKEIFEAYKYK